MNAPEKLDLVSIRASSLAELFACPARWSAKYLDGKRLPRSAAAQLGTPVHATTAVFDASRLDGASPVTADDAAGALVDAIHNPEEDVDWEDTRVSWFFDVIFASMAIPFRFSTEFLLYAACRGPLQSSFGRCSEPAICAQLRATGP